MKDRPGAELDVTYGYDLLGRLKSASQAGSSLTFTYDALGRRLTESGPHGIVASAWDLAGRRTRLTHPDGFFVDQDYLVTGELTKIREYGAASGAGVLATFAYDDLGRRDRLTRGSGLVTRYGYDPVSRLASLAHDFGGNGNDLAFTLAYNPAGQIVRRSGAHGAYAWAGTGTGSAAASHDGLNRIVELGGTGIGHDARGNVTAIGSAGYAYTSDNLMVSAPGASLAYDPLDRLRSVSGGGGGQRVYDGAELIAELDSGGTALLRRHVFGPGADEPLVWYEGSGTTDRRQLIADERGSIVGAFDASAPPSATAPMTNTESSSRTGAMPAGSAIPARPGCPRVEGKGGHYYLVHETYSASEARDLPDVRRASGFKTAVCDSNRELSLEKLDQLGGLEDRFGALRA